MSKRLASPKAMMGDKTLAEFGVSTSRDGFIIYAREGTRDVHLTIITKGNRVNAHITDTGAKDQTIWSMNRAVDNLVQDLNMGVKRTIQRYNWNETFHVLDKGLIDAIGLPLRIDDHYPTSIDLLPLFTFVTSLKRERMILSKMSIRDGLRRGHQFGLQFSKTQTYAVIPIDEKMCFRVNIDPRRNFLNKIPMMVGIRKYFDYLDHNKIIDVGGPEVKKEMAKLITSGGIIGESHAP